MVRSLVIFGLVGLLAAVAVLFWQSHTPPPGPAAGLTPDGAASANVAPVASAPASVPVTTVQPKKINPLVNTIAALRFKLREWQDMQVNDPDNEEDQDRLMKEMLALVTDENVAQVIQSFSADEMNTAFGIGALHHWMQVDPAAASNWLAARPETTKEQTIAVADDWIGNADGLKQYVDQLPDTAWKQNFLQAAGSEVTVQDPREAIKLSQEMKPGDAQTNLLRSVACSWISADPNAALDWVANVKDPALREQLVASAVQSYALTDPAQAAAWLVSEVKSDGVVNDAAINIVNTWSSKNPAEAASWVSQFPDGEVKAAAIKTVLQYWRQTDSTAADAWVQSLAGAPVPPAQ